MRSTSTSGLLLGLQARKVDELASQWAFEELKEWQEEVKAAKPEAGANPKKAAAPKAAKSPKKTSSSAAAASAGEKKVPVKNSQETTAAKADASAEKPGVPAKKPGVMETLRESARVTDPEERTLTYINPLSALKLGAAVNVCLLVIVLAP